MLQIKKYIFIVNQSNDNISVQNVIVLLRMVFGMRKYKKRIDEISKEVERIKKEMAVYCANLHKELNVFEGIANIKYIPNPFEIADYKEIKYKFIPLKGDMPSYLNEFGVIYISNEYNKKSYEAKLLCAHELGHYFLHDYHLSAMNNDELNEYMPEQIIKEYEANVFAVLLMPQIMAGYPWRDYPPKMLNRKVYNKVMKRNC